MYTNLLEKYSEPTFLVMYDDGFNSEYSEFDDLEEAMAEVTSSVENEEFTNVVIYKAYKLVDKSVKVTDL